jgi:phosphoribosylanthranilate isomerase
MPQMVTRTRIKICGITRPDDVAAVARLGVDAVGLNFYPKSKRYVSVAIAREIVAAAPAFLDFVGVFVGASLQEIRETLNATGIGSIQLHHQEPPEMVRDLGPWRTLRAFGWEGPQTAGDVDHYLKKCREFGRLPAGVLLDTYKAGISGGTGEAWHWDQLGTWRPAVPLVLAGGLKPDNVAAAIVRIQPDAVDVAGGVESAPGIKDLAKVANFIEAVRWADRHTTTVDI